jgi:hypothetical protein
MLQVWSADGTPHCLRELQRTSKSWYSETFPVCQNGAIPKRASLASSVIYFDFLLHLVIIITIIIIIVIIVFINPSKHSGKFMYKYNLLKYIVFYPHQDLMCTRRKLRNGELHTLFLPITAQFDGQWGRLEGICPRVWTEVSVADSGPKDNLGHLRTRCRNCSACKTKLFESLVIFQSAHRFETGIWLSDSRMFMILLLYWLYNPIWVLASSLVLQRPSRFRNRFFWCGVVSSALTSQPGGPCLSYHKTVQETCRSHIYSQKVEK